MEYFTYLRPNSQCIHMEDQNMYLQNSTVLLSIKVNIRGVGVFFQEEYSKGWCGNNRE